jgi:hypothetical protein
MLGKLRAVEVWLENVAVKQRNTFSWRGPHPRIVLYIFPRIDPFAQYFQRRNYVTGLRLREIRNTP